MSSRKTITVFGATGLQGGNVASKFLDDPELNTTWTVRAVARDVSKPAAQKLAEQGAQVVVANGEYETQQGKNLADAVKEAGIQYYIWSSLPNVQAISKGKLTQIFHFDSKAKVEDYVRELDIPATLFLAGLYMSEIAGGRPSDVLKPQLPDNAWTLTLPCPSSASYPLFDPGDTGKFVKAIVLHREELLGKHVLGATAYVSGQEVLDTFKKLYPEAGREARYFQIPEDLFRELMKAQGLAEYMINEVWENLLFVEEFGYYGGESLDETHRLVSEPLTSWEEYARDLAPGFKELK